MTYHALKEGALLGDIQVYDKRSQKNLADLFTKNVNSFTVSNLVEILCGYRHTRWCVYCAHTHTGSTRVCVYYAHTPIWGNG